MPATADPRRDPGPRRQQWARRKRGRLEAIANDLDEPNDALRPRLVTAAALAALTSLENTTHDNAEQRPTKAEVLAVLDDAMLFLRGGIDALQDK